jgi:hypothetical protein
VVILLRIRALGAAPLMRVRLKIVDMPQEALTSANTSNLVSQTPPFHLVPPFDGGDLGGVHIALAGDGILVTGAYHSVHPLTTSRSCNPILIV